MLAMSATAVLLGYMNPRRHVASPEQMERIMRAAVQVVEDADSLTTQPWQGIEVLAVEESRGGTMLAATRDEGAWHFHIGADGIPVRGQTWGRPNSSLSAARCITIHLSKPYASDDFLPLQVIGVRALVSTIHQCLRQSAETLPVRFIMNG